MKLKDTIKQDLTTKEGMVKFGHEPIDSTAKILITSLPSNSYARKHVDALLVGMAEFKIKLYDILDGYQDYIERKESVKK